MRTLRIAAAVEAVSLIVLLLNLATVHARAVSTLVGPLHGAAYLATIAATASATASTAARRRAAVPGVGGLLALRRLGGRGDGG
ncbi:DUF3817 domain-containing protein [Streptomyces sp. B1866]|uniref:DUF3817 domain-containing protein n=1 Tax=Streptomyces sp. B1866 TaxID=3075431 RepID=UPI0028900C18|nr:DUF3817 domain-containing protein [Streptomyces sp. B1866]MDT3395372.1 DUF3817 domain-containing protein [Streptomyces sp. B1866]